MGFQEDIYLSPPTGHTINIIYANDGITHRIRNSEKHVREQSRQHIQLSLCISNSRNKLGDMYLTTILSPQIHCFLLNGTNCGCHGNPEGTQAELPNLFFFLCKQLFLFPLQKAIIHMLRDTSSKLRCSINLLHQFYLYCGMRINLLQM